MVKKLFPLFKMFKAPDWTTYFLLKDINFVILDHLRSKHSLAFCLIHDANPIQNAKGVSQGNMIHSWKKHCVSQQLINILHLLGAIIIFNCILRATCFKSLWLTVKTNVFSSCPKFLLFHASKSPPRPFLCFGILANTNILMLFMTFSTLIISPCSLHLCELKVLIFLVWPHVFSPHIPLILSSSLCWSF